MARRSYRYNNYYPSYTSSGPKEVKGGIKAQSKKGSFGESWWARRWVEVLEGFDIGERLNRGKRYARSGQVLSIDVVPGKVTAKVQGSRATPYKVTIEMKPLDGPAKNTLCELLGRDFAASAQLHGGELPATIETLFRGAGASLFPQSYKDIAIDCSCPDWSNPCKHGAAVCYLLAEEFDRDPLLLLSLRGLDRADFANLPGVSAAGHHMPSHDQSPAQSLPLDVDHGLFWGNEHPPEPFSYEMTLPGAHSGPARRLGAFPFWRGEIPFQDALDAIYDRASRMVPSLLAGVEDS